MTQRKAVRTPAGDLAWKNIPMPPEERKMLNKLKEPSEENDLKQIFGPTYDVLLAYMIKRGWAKWEELAKEVKTEESTEHLLGEHKKIFSRLKDGYDNPLDRLKKKMETLKRDQKKQDETGPQEISKTQECFKPHALSRMSDVEKGAKTPALLLAEEADRPQQDILSSPPQESLKAEGTSQEEQEKEIQNLTVVEMDVKDNPLTSNNVSVQGTKEDHRNDKDDHKKSMLPSFLQSVLDEVEISSQDVKEPALSVDQENSADHSEIQVTKTKEFVPTYVSEEEKQQSLNDFFQMMHGAKKIHENSKKTQPEKKKDKN